jgi:hypothetical protein
MIKLYTNAHGIDLWKMDKSFWAWTKDDGENYEEGNTPFLADEKDVRMEDYLIKAGAEIEILL